MPIDCPYLFLNSLERLSKYINVETEQYQSGSFVIKCRVRNDFASNACPFFQESLL